MIRNISLGTPSLGFLCILFLLHSIFLPAMAQAKNPYEVHRATEGDPGDGVLEPVAPTVGETEDEASLPLSSSFPSWGFESETRFPLIIFIGSDPTPVILWMPIPGPARSPFESTVALPGLRVGRGW